MLCGATQPAGPDVRTLLIRSVAPQCYPDGVERDPVIEEYKKHVDRALLRENLKLTEQRLLYMVAKSPQRR